MSPRAAVVFAPGPGASRRRSSTPGALPPMRRLAATRRILESLSDATLRDIGFSRGESGSVASEIVGLVERTRWRLIGSARLPAP